jgi:hypothetical protein
MRILNEVKNERSELNMSKKEVPLDRHKNKLTIMKQMIEDESINTDECVVASTYMNAEFPYLNKKLSVANAMLNRHFNPQYQKQPENRIVFYCFNEKVFNNCHSHIYLKLPKHLMFAAVIEKFQEIFRRLDDRTNENRKYKFRVHNETIDDQFKFLEYCLKRYDVNNADTFVVI